MQAGGLGSWLAERCKQESLSLRQAAAKTGISHATVADIITGEGWAEKGNGAP